MFSCCYIINSLSFIYIKNRKNSACHTVDHVTVYSGIHVVCELRGQMSSPVNHLGGGGQMSSYTIFHRGADVRGGKCPAPVVSLCILYCTITMCLMVRFRQVFHIFQRTLVSFSAQKSKRADMSRVMRKPEFCICENKDADQLHGNREADLRLCFRYIDSSIHLLPKSEISSL